MYTPDESSNVKYLMTHMKNQISSLDDPLPSLCDTLQRWFGSESSWLKSLFVILIMLLAVLLVICLQDCCLLYYMMYNKASSQINDN